MRGTFPTLFAATKFIAQNAVDAYVPRYFNGEWELALKIVAADVVAKAFNTDPALVEAIALEICHFTLADEWCITKEEQARVKNPPTT